MRRGGLRLPLLQPQRLVEPEKNPATEASVCLQRGVVLCRLCTVVKEGGRGSVLDRGNKDTKMGKDISGRRGTTFGQKPAFHIQTRPRVVFCESSA